jgi:hypothetical protein
MVLLQLPALLQLANNQAKKPRDNSQVKSLTSLILIVKVFVLQWNISKPQNAKVYVHGGLSYDMVQ